MSIPRITIETGMRGGRPCVRHSRIAAHDVQGWLASGMSEAEILEDYPELERADILACLAINTQTPFALSLSKGGGCEVSCSGLGVNGAGR